MKDHNRLPIPFIIKTLCHAQPGKKLVACWRKSEKSTDTRRCIITVKEIDVKNYILITEEGHRFDLSRGDFDVLYSNRILIDDGAVRFYYHEEF